MAQETPIRAIYMDFTSPYIEVSTVIVTKTGTPYIDNMAKIKTKKLGIVKGYSLVSLFKKKFPKINILEVDSLKDGLNKVVCGEIFGYIDNSIVLNTEIQKNYLGRLNISGKFDINFILGVGTRNDEKILHDIFEKAILSISKETKQNILDKWIRINYSTKTDYTIILNILLVSAIIIISFIYWNRELKKEIKVRKKAESLSLKNELRFRTLFNMSPIMVDSFDKNGKCTLWNKECEKVFGWSIDEINEHENTLALFYPDEKIQADILASFTSQTKNIFREWHPVTKDGKTISTMWANIVLDNGEIINIGYDFTELRDTKIKLNELNASLEDRVKSEIQKNEQHQLLMMQQSRLIEAGKTISMIAHQWRHPLNNLSLIIQNIIFQYKIGNLDDSLIDTLDKQSNQQIKDMSNTIKDFRDFFKPERKKTNFKVADSVNLALSITKPVLNEKDILIDFKIENNATFYGYQNELGQSIVNILNNSMDALLDNKTNNNYIKISLSKEDDTIFIKIKDNAGGINEDIIEKIFDPYFSTKIEKNGTGLGLYMTKTIIEEHMGGTIRVFNDTDGAYFVIKLHCV